MADEITRRHVNGGALKIGTEVHVSADSFCDEHSAIKGSHIFSSSVINSRVLWDSRIFNSQVGHSVLVTADVAESTLHGIVATDAVLHKVRAETAGLEPSMADRMIKLIGVVAENCELYGNWSLDGNFRIHEGIWHRSPRSQRITGENGVDTGITECKPGYAMLACWCKPISELLYAGPRLGRRHKWTEEQINTAKLFYEMIRDVPMEM